MADVLGAQNKPRVASLEGPPTFEVKVVLAISAISGILLTSPKNQKIQSYCLP
jgi:hypothetical protein